MPTAATLADLDLLARGGVCGLLILVAAILIRDHRGLIPARLGAAFAISGAAHAITMSPGVCGQIGLWSTPLVVLSSGGNVVFWLFSRALFEDDFKPRPAHALIWLAVVTVGAIQGLVLAPPHHPLAPWFAGALTLETLFFVGLAVAQVLAAWKGDLVEPRRRLRLWVIGVAGAYMGLRALSDLTGVRQAAPEAAGLLDSLGLVLVAGAVALALLRIPGGELLFGREATAPPPRLEPEDAQLAGALDHAMTVDRAYRQDGLTIGALAARQGLTEHRLRRLINQGLGHRNFNAFLNSHRIAEARAALADPTQVQVPILTIALDTGFASLGPFNRAFKAETGQTPTDYRRRALADSEIGQA
ncbi:helix-turn-helix domain-containing protein [Phenylobacterium aquaticum]|uniref:AraC family transcriptional regulator n=1 Tax=Phenylobacterium aquaticum TaxID=1763816 RepID=UPI0026ECA19F|nr:helix-turn-helix domain-containing protein [Phenylobacterium aquaticum]